MNKTEGIEFKKARAIPKEYAYVQVTGDEDQAYQLTDYINDLLGVKAAKVESLEIGHTGRNVFVIDYDGYGIAPTDYVLISNKTVTVATSEEFGEMFEKVVKPTRGVGHSERYVSPLGDVHTITINASPDGMTPDEIAKRVNDALGRQTNRG